MTPNDPGKTVRDLVDLLQRGNAVVPPELLPLAGGSASFYRRPAISSHRDGPAVGAYRTKPPAIVGSSRRSASRDPIPLSPSLPRAPFR